MSMLKKQALLLAATSHAAEVSRLKQSLARAQEELGRVRKQLEDKQGAATEVETLKAALAEAEKRAADEQSVREKHEARVGEVQQELQDAVKKCESLERKIADQARKMPGLKPRAPPRKSKRPRKLRREHLWICRAALLMLRNYSVPKRGAQRRSCFGRNTLRQNIRCPLAIS
ncbi:uncharacterized protein [Aegilops tauschii subsp. strangulata]|uniref:uncharacterized protein n=1 Tax=Aegilops tauschii subsp. strangulata TaxID=200361 RepID=UPI001E1CAC69|nr:uncharacterized protein LOC120967831 [Aegilops tauschii subsp. strangulata]